MKKKIAILTALLAVGMTFAACGGNKSASEAETTAAETTAETTLSEPVSEEATEAEEDIIPDESEPLEVLPGDEEVSEDEGAEPVVPEEAVSDNPLFPAVEKALAESEWPSLMEVTDETILKEFFLLDPANENYKEMIVMQCPISAVMSEIIIINAEDVSSAEADLEARKTKAIEQDAWYPKDQELAAASIVGTDGNYAYFIIGENAASAEASITEYIASLS
ncbi:MAG: DUF4358 domain-containing protein [Oscillospiraceae bacterium]|nr:DUF4358 domain-containing protein [Oscillospiraceae bacterium]